MATKLKYAPATTTASGGVMTQTTHLVAKVYKVYAKQDFMTDLAKSSKKIDQMAADARKAHREGKTRKFPE